MGTVTTITLRFILISYPDLAPKGENFLTALPKILENNYEQRDLYSN